MLTVETQLLVQRRVALDIGARRQYLQIALIRALGGGFSEYINEPILPVAITVRP